MSGIHPDSWVDDVSGRITTWVPFPVRVHNRMGVALVSFLPVRAVFEERQARSLVHEFEGYLPGALLIECDVRRVLPFPARNLLILV